jgi:predicted DNA-binding protein
MVSRMPKRLNVMNIRLDDELKDGLKELADHDDRPLATYIVRILRRHLEEERAKKGKS